MIDLISQHIEQLVNGIDTTISVVWNNDEQRGETCNTKWVRKGKVLTVGIDSFIVDNVEPNEWITVQQTPPPTFEGIVSIPVPFYIHGTKKATNREWTISTNDLTQKTPIVWLLGPVRYTAFGRESSKEYEADLRLFFLDETDPVNYYTDDHLEQVVYPMEQLANAFLLTLQNDSNYASIDQWEVIEFSRFGTEQDNGFFQNILDANLSGVELRFTLTRYKNNICNC